MFPADVQQATLAAHPDLYRRHADGYVTTRIERGTMDIGSVVDEAFGVGFDFDPSRFTPIDQWTYASLVAR